MTIAARPWACAALAFVILAACSSKTPPSGAVAAKSTSSTADTEESTDDPCALLEPGEVEKVLGAHLAVPPFRAASGPDSATEDGESCVYETANFQYIELEVTFDHGTTAYSMVNFGKKLLGGAPNPTMAKEIKNAFKLDDGTELTGEWDEATLTPMNCCIFNALRGDQMISIDFTGSRATLPKAAELIDAAFKRIDKPLKIDGNAGVNAAKELTQHRVKPVDPCSLLTRQQVEAIVGPLVSDPVRKGNDICTYQQPSEGIPRLLEVQFTWKGGYYKYRSDSHTAGLATGMMRGMIEDSNARPPPDVAEKMATASVGNGDVAPNDAWEQAEIRGMELAAVKKDVLVTINLRGVKAADAQNLMVALMKRI